MKHTCEYYMERYLMLDKGMRIPSDIRRHMLHCKKCSSEIRALNKAEKVSSAPIHIPENLKSNTIAEVLKKVAPGYEPKMRHVPLISWIIFGLIMLTTMVLFATIMKEDALTMFAFSLSSALLISGYCLTLIAANIDLFVKRMKVKIRNSVKTTAC
ncbi:MAG: hypothetical protein VZR56_05995 [Treponema sp.]|nr:hypothetical protein [Treponema sp.]